MSTGEENKVLIRRYFAEIWDKGNTDAEANYVAQDAVVHASPLPGAPPGREGAIQVVKMFRAAFSDLSVNIEELIAEDDKVAQRWTSRVTHDGPLLGIPPTGKHITISGINIFRIADGKIVERWGDLDRMSLLQQLGVIPTA
jgi:steroid delta-isomerase-like uncharacterized protein